MIFHLRLKFTVSISSAQNDANFRKEKMQSLKTRGEKQTSAAGTTINRSNTPILAASSPNGQHQPEQTTRIDRLLKEIDALRETNKSLAEQVQVSDKFTDFF